MKTTIHIPRILLGALAATSMLMMCSCDHIDEVPPMKESTTNKSYKIPDPTPMTAADNAIYNEIRAEYQNGTSL